MLHRVLKIGDWMVDFLFAKKKYDIDGVLSCLYDADAPMHTMRRAYRIMTSGRYNRGFTYANNGIRRAVLVVGPATSGKQFQNTLSHEIDHLSDFISASYEMKDDDEATAYLTGDTTMELAKIICELGCERCNPDL